MLHGSKRNGAMTGDKAKSDTAAASRRGADDARVQRLAAALRDNLRRRKAQARNRTSAQGDTEKEDTTSES